MLGILQLSDIHFAHSEDSIFDLDRELQDGLLRFLPSLRERVGPIGLIVVSGDIAYSGIAEQYERASGFLRDVRSRLDAPAIPVRVIPGNHDIHLPATDNADQRVWRGRARRTTITADERDAVMRELLLDDRAGPGLLEPLQAYNDFAATFECAISARQPNWEHRFALDEGWTLRVRGLTSVLVSNEHDKKDRLVLGSVQLSGWQTEPGEVNLTLCHHPDCWLLDGESLRPKLQNRSHLHITGHVHQHGFERQSSHVHLRAGAMQPPRQEKVSPRFNAIGLRVVGDSAAPELEVTLVPVIWDKQADSFKVDEDNCEACTLRLEPTPQDQTASAPPEDAAAISRLTERLGTLLFSDRLHAARSIGLPVSDVLRRPTHEMVNRIMEYAAENRRLVELWEQVELRHGQQTGEANPFQEQS